MMARMLAGLSLAVCLAAPFLFFWERMGADAHKTSLAIASLAWFVFGTIALRRRRHS
jgi:hypothetical protein